jgi:hypothetical protein
VLIAVIAFWTVEFSNKEGKQLCLTRYFKG